MLASAALNIGIAAAIVILVGVYVVWVLSQANRRSCPYCALQGDDEPLLPVLGNFLWLCLSCWRLQPSPAAARANQILLSERQARQRLAERLPGRRRRPEAEPDEEPASVDDAEPPRFR